MKKHFLFTAALFAALSLGFVSCENPDDSDLLQQIEDLKSELMDVKDMLSDADKDKDKGSDKDEKPSSDSGDKEDTETPVSCFTPAAFSVSSTKQVYFSPGNLQYHPANKEWRFAPSQLDYIGEANRYCSSTYNGWLDLFGWSTSATHFGVSTSTSSSNYSGSFVDWGTNQISDDVPNTWRTLTNAEWEYLLETRTNASLKGVAEVNGVNGLILLPDNWTCPDGITFKPGFHSSDGWNYYAAYQTFTADQWSKIEAAGAVFLPAAGYRSGSAVGYVQDYGYYWSATEDDSGFARCLYFYSDAAGMGGNYRNLGQSVRLVKDL